MQSITTIYSMVLLLVIIESESAFTKIFLPEQNENKQRKALAASFMQSVLVNEQLVNYQKIITPILSNTNPFIDNTVPGLLKGMEELQTKGVSIQIKKIF